MCRCSGPHDVNAAGEARTEAMVASAQKEEGFDGHFDAFAEPANLILSTVIKMLPDRYSGRAELLRKADAIKLPGNPLVSSHTVYCVS